MRINISKKHAKTTPPLHYTKDKDMIPGNIYKYQGNDGYITFVNSEKICYIGYSKGTAGYVTIGYHSQFGNNNLALSKDTVVTLTQTNI